GNAVQLNAPFSLAPGAGDMTSPTVTYRLATGLPSASIFDYWDPADAVQRLISGAAVNEMAIKVNADFHEFTFSGEAADLLDSVSFTNGQAGLSTYPVEPAVLPLAYDVIPGHLGQVWMGTTASRFYTLTEAEVKLDNDLDLRANEFGSERPSCVSAGRRNVSLNLSLYEQRNAMTRDLYEAARNQTPITVMFQLGQQPGQLFGVYLNSVVPEVPEFDDSDPRLQWRFKNCRAQGSDNDELILAFA
ncbi:MAG TPA: phage tail tube protein, partial [Bryobacteraceae bacterium]|nr:phage tail tube protein [Bryobacteraceae bacterium]